MTDKDAEIILGNQQALLEGMRTIMQQLLPNAGASDIRYISQRIELTMETRRDIAERGST